jgi:structural maintenance of chromosome 2
MDGGMYCSASPFLNSFSTLISTLLSQTRSFDPHFNAITGLNGSGKSNILDSICFVLGITNLSQVRAGNLSELVYKQGQAGVNKAVVTIVFNNEDASNSPVGFEQCPEVTVTRQVLLGGKSKYLINGRNAPASAVQNFFHSVQLNVNNPHFLIMQGRITKVLNMKAHEILGMVEEAAGTRMYETKRVAALKTIDKKQAKVDEINAVLEEEITPTLERLRGEKQNYLKWSKNSADLERLDRFCIAHQFQVAQAALEQNAEGVSAMEEQVKELDTDAEKYREEIAAKEEEIALTSSKLKGEMDSRLAKTKKVEQERSNELVRITSIWKNCQENMAKAESDLDAAKQLVEETQNAVVAKEQEIEDDVTAAKETVEAAATAENELERLTVEYQTMSAGMSATTENRTLPEQISQAHADSKTAESKVAQAKLKLTHLSKELKVRRPLLCFFTVCPRISFCSHLVFYVVLHYSLSRMS